MIYSFVRTKRPSGMAIILVVLLIICLLQGILWLLGIRRIDEEITQLRWLQSSRERSAATNLAGVQKLRSELEQGLLAYEHDVYQVRTPLEAETSLLQILAAIAEDARVTVLSTQLLPTQSFDNLVRFGVELRGRGSPDAMVYFFHRLSQVQPRHVVESVRVDTVPGTDDVSVSMIVTAVALLGSESAVGTRPALPEDTGAEPIRTTLFGQPTTEVAPAGSVQVARCELGWGVLGIVHGPPEPAALLTNTAASGDRLVRVGDTVDGALVLDVQPEFVIVKCSGEIITLRLLPNS